MCPRRCGIIQTEYSATYTAATEDHVFSIVHIWEPDGSGSVLCGDPAPVSAVGLAEAETMQSALLCPDCMARAVEAYPAVNDG
jgi:hypothetical protein